MTMCALSPEDTPAEILTAQRRAPRAKPLRGVGGIANLENNYLAEAGQAPTTGDLAHRNRPGAGAPKGNRNALKTGDDTAERRARRARVRTLCRAAREAIAQTAAKRPHCDKALPPPPRPRYNQRQSGDSQPAIKFQGLEPWRMWR
jgi:hypothetical protein